MRRRPRSGLHPWIEAFQEHLLVEEGRSERTADGYTRDLTLLEQFLRREGSDFASADPLVLSSFLYYLQKERRNGEAARARKVSCIRTFYSFLVRQGYVRENPAEELRAPRVPSHEPIFLSQEEATALLEAARRAGTSPVRDHAMVATLLYTGCRVSELTGLRLRDVSFAGESVRLFGKGAKERVVPLHPDLARILRGYLRVRRVPRGSPAPDRLFRNLHGGPLTRHGVHYLIKRMAAALPESLPGLSAHKLRHTMATLLLEKDADLRSIQELLGHASVATTQRYTHVVNRRLREQVRKLEF
ncbi:tyrosine recombinase XerD [Limnochorda pilosa]|uniref:Tyrosine recombinase XerD n=1 Tax=Limnochorda pilosa TaxID=1555112 RepID=A0A0K2SKG5_LIMPI|nr:tyrosine recombinase XerD [Limnochorda pilosa]